MKIKMDFVTNSSTTNYCLIGIELSTSELVGLLKSATDKNEDREELEKKIFRLGLIDEYKDFDNFDNYDIYEIYEHCDKLLEKEGLYCIVNNNNDCVYIGIDIRDVDKKKTILKIEEEVSDKLKKFNINQTVDIIFGCIENR